MLRALIFVLLVLALGYGFSLLADTPGEVAITVAGQLITVDLITAAALLIAALVAVFLIWWIIKVVLTAPMRTQRFFRARKRDRGYQSLSTGIIAAGAGDPETARKMLKQANGLLTQTSEPLLDLLDAQTTMLEGDHDTARQKFEAMLDDPETRTLALRGLYLEADRLGDREAQKHYAEKAAELAPQLAWAGRAAIAHKTIEGDWEGALRLVETQKTRKQITKDEAKRKRAVLLTAKAMDMVEADPTSAKSAALEAHKLAPDFAPAATVCAEAAQRLNDMRRAVKVLEITWKAAPHPDVALAYVNARPGDSATDRLKRANKLEQLKPNTIESSMIVAQMALEASEFEKAREAVAAVLRNEPRESAYMLMADIEDAETGNQGKMREWLARAVRAPRDPAWTADGYVSQSWAPFSPVTGEFDAFEWKVPVERLGGALIDNDLDPMQAGSAPASDVPTIEAAAAGAVAGSVLAAEDDDAPEAVDTIEAAETVIAETAEEISDDKIIDAKPEEPANDPVEAPVEDQKEADAEPAPAEAAPAPTANGAVENTEPEDTEPEEPIKAPIPDDPGIPDEDDDKTDKPGRFRLF